MSLQNFKRKFPWWKNLRCNNITDKSEWDINVTFSLKQFFITQFIQKKDLNQDQVMNL